MPRANRYFEPGHVYHITHRCHKREFLLKFLRDRQRWLSLLFKAKKLFGLIVLDYAVTSNHIHLLVKDNGEDVIPKSMKLIAGKSGQEYNKRKNRKAEKKMVHILSRCPKFLTVLILARKRTF